MVYFCLPHNLYIPHSVNSLIFFHIFVLTICSNIDIIAVSFLGVRFFPNSRLYFWFCFQQILLSIAFCLYANVLLSSIPFLNNFILFHVCSQSSSRITYYPLKSSFALIMFIGNSDLCVIQLFSFTVFCLQARLIHVLDINIYHATQSLIFSNTSVRDFSSLLSTLPFMFSIQSLHCQPSILLFFNLHFITWSNCTSCY